jgi:hypothetical protein
MELPRDTYSLQFMFFDMQTDNQDYQLRYLGVALS